MFNTLASILNVGYAEWGNPERLDSFLNEYFWSVESNATFREHPLKGEKMPRLFAGDNQGGSWLFADTVVNITNFRGALGKAFKTAGIPERKGSR